MEMYLGVKLVWAEPMDHFSFLEEQGKPYSTEENQHGYKVVYEDGYVSWSPKDVFEKAYRKIKLYKDVEEFILENDKNFKDYQLRVCEEAFELDNKILKLHTFIEINHDGIEVNELNRMKQQLMAMQYYLTILIERIENF